MRTNVLTKIMATGAVALGITFAAPAAANACAYADTRPTASTNPNPETRAYENFLTGLRASGAVICLTNAQRTARGVPALAKNRALTAAAERHTNDMVSRRYFSHTSPEGYNALYRIRQQGYCLASCAWGENIRWGSGSLSTPRAAVQAWMASSGHRANILNPNFRSIGVGAAPFAPNSYTGQAATYTQVFGSL